jgi:ABC-type cobalamin transport system permease subunit
VRAVTSRGDDGAGTVPEAAKRRASRLFTAAMFCTLVALLGLVLVTLGGHQPLAGVLLYGGVALAITATAVAIWPLYRAVQAESRGRGTPPDPDR